MGEVYVAEDTKLQRRVALKVLPQELATDPERRSRFEREARAVAALNHPNIVTVHSVEEAAGVHFITMELVKGKTLAEMLPETGFALSELLEIAVPLADAVSSAHRTGITHRDLKPDNIMVDNEGRLRVLDFGLAKLHDPSGAGEGTHLDTASAMTAEGAILGTVAYMSPEQAEGKAVDQRSDVFSLGTILFEMATGKRPFRGDTSMSTISAILKDEPAKVTELNPGVPQDLEQIIGKALEKDPGRRYQSAGELRDELRKLQRDPGRRAWTSLPLRIAGAAFVMLGLALTVMVLWPSADRAPVPTPTDDDPVPSKGPSIAVLSFVNASGDPEQDYFSSGLTDDISTELSRYSELFVIAHPPTLTHEEGSVDVREVGAALDVHYVLQGSVRRAGQRIRVTVQLSDAREGRFLWGDNYERDLTATDLFRLQDELTQQVVNAIAGSYGALSRSELAEARRKPPASLDSYDCVLRTYEYLHVHDPSNHLEARRCLEAAVELDPGYADGWAWLAYLYAEEYHHRRNERPESYDSLDRSLEAAERAARLDPENQVSQGALAMTYLLRGDRERGRVAAYRAIELNPNNALWLGLLGTWLSVGGDFDRGVPMAQRALVLNPNPPPWVRMPIYLEHYHNGRFEAALDQAQKIETEDYRTPLFLAAAYGQLDRHEEARRALSKMRALSSGLTDGIRQDLIQRSGFAPELVDRLLEGIRKVGWVPEPPALTSCLTRCSVSVPV